MIDFSVLKDCRYTVIGDPIAHSRSPQMQNAGFAALGLGTPYGRLHVPVEELPLFAEYARKHLDGANLTVPHKNRILPELADMSPEARLCGSVNTLLVRDGKLYGDTTDGYGFAKAVEEAFGLVPENLRAVFFGAGGAARAVVFYLAAHGAKSITLANRTVEKAELLAQDLRSAYPETEVHCAGLQDTHLLAEFLDGADLAVQATSMGLHKEDAPPFDLTLLERRKGLCCFDMIYHSTPFLRAAESAGLPNRGGNGMLLHQGARSLELWTGKTAPVEIMREALK
ncbi:MAG: shikimate dehydrogenase [Lentisphaeria bacterium]|nr:shikimate dehydrogenase [Lentisphaeria bacterium]